MVNAVQAKSLVGAVLLTAAIEGALLLGINDLAVQGAANAAQDVISRAAATSKAAHAASRRVTLASVVIVGKREPFADGQVRVVAMQVGCIPVVTGSSLHYEKTAKVVFC